MLRFTDNSLAHSTPADYAVGITEITAGTRENQECSGRGVCNTGTGVCVCSTGYRSGTPLVYIVIFDGLQRSGTPQAVMFRLYGYDYSL